MPAPWPGCRPGGRIERFPSGLRPDPVHAPVGRPEPALDRERIEKAVAGYYAAFRDRDAEAWMALFTEEVVSHSPVGGPQIRGLDGMRLAFKTVMNTLSEVEFEYGPIFVGGNCAAVKWTARGTGHTGRAVTFEGINVFTLRLDGRIRRIDAYWDPNDLMRQINR